VEVIAFRNLRGAGTAQISFTGGITAFCGSNGVGKSTILRALREALYGVECDDDDDDDEEMERIEVRLAVGNKTSIRAAVSPPTAEQQSDTGPEVVFFDGGEFSVRLRRLFAEMPSVAELLESSEPREARPDELEDASYVIGRQYDAIKTYEVDVGEEDEVPYFVVTSAGYTYRTESMGQGELAALALLWTLRRLKGASILLLEEPETYLAPRSQEALLNVLARYSTKKAIWIALSTHSEAILRRIPIEHVRLCYRTADKVKIISPSSQAQYLTQLGITPRRRGVVLVEDVVARELAIGWAGYFEPQLLQEFEIVAVPGGESEIRRALMFPQVGSWLKIVGLFDGDQRNFKDATIWPYAFLPGDVSPEVLIRRIVSARLADVAVQLARPEHEIALALSVAEGRDAHDWLVEFVRHVGVPVSALIMAFFRVWLSDQQVRAAVEEEFRAFERLL
jgi:predicted ATPase